MTYAELLEWRAELHRAYRALDDDDYLGEHGETIRVSLRQIRRLVKEMNIDIAAFSVSYDL
ncbi:hypothetical protein K3G63_10990 [Hymenobacter sp. HSC-4F20]|uniref:hypothetical protein n=1 Tax=Hymenobacter sp. HSC-4F20 TaxID=2864135 RepID=UPI001C72CFB5|nr:hypothetical protein [Hymenobacter sp. HSC-4F20]MBX0290968.1 hypothetical protein [Hymenobacter sp. HSC-4F20]